MNTVVGSRIIIEDPTEDVVAWAKERLRFPNPEYAKLERMGKWLGRTPKELRIYEWNGRKLILPFGVCREIMPLLKGTLVTCDFRQDSVVKYGGETVPLWDYQEEAVRKMVEAKYGILQSTTGSGKTQMGVELIKRIRRRALWLCHTADLLRQSMDRAMQYMDPEMIGTITEGKVNVGVGVTFATVQTMANLELTQYRDYWDVVIVDECHRVSVSADSFTRYQKVLSHLAARHKYGLTATPERSDGLIQATFALLGRVMWVVPDAAVADKVTGVTVRPVETRTEMGDECLNDDGTINYVKLITYITEDLERNKLIARYLMQADGHSCLILSERLAQLEKIIGLLPGTVRSKCAFINGKMQSKAAKAERERLIEQMRTGEKRLLFASYSLAKEGLDVPRLDRLYLASPTKYSAVITQAVGRVRRRFEGKDMPVVYDFVDVEIGYCERAYRERCRSYRKLGAVIERGFLRG